MEGGRGDLKCLPSPGERPEQFPRERVRIQGRAEFNANRYQRFLSSAL